MSARVELTLLVALGLGSGCCFQMPEPPKADAGEACLETSDCAAGACLRGFCAGRHCCRNGTGGCTPDCSEGWSCSHCTKLFCEDHCEKLCQADTDCPATWRCVGSRCEVAPNPTTFHFPDGGFLVRRNGTTELFYEVTDAEDGFLDGGMTFRDDSRPEQPVVELWTQRASYTFGPLDFEGGLQAVGVTRFGTGLQAFAPFIVCREAAEACAPAKPCCEGLGCTDAGVCAP